MLREFTIKTQGSNKYLDIKNMWFLGTVWQMNSSYHTVGEAENTGTGKYPTRRHDQQIGGNADL